MNSGQGPNVTDPDARALLAAASAANTALDYLLCSVRDGEPPNVEEILQALADATNCTLDRYRPDPLDGEARAFHAAARAILGQAAPEDEPAE